ncbi:hypothetical protein D9X30_4848 [Cupriavidus sp. U2]|uniref:hypothetical protein n=1 Tax=Cupriavidus sp. U2 TaxID=2920269 RepID=UPI00129D9F3C|nr:hypothetical protein [Cupriavidus sp. U2]KAI3590240.1 hypothetical protein D9X30_4848 [Cupriavidus sp. U2]
MSRTLVHPLENNATERAYFTDTLPRTSTSAVAAYRRAVEALTGSLPTWAQRQRTGRKPRSLPKYGGDPRAAR